MDIVTEGNSPDAIAQPRPCVRCGRPCLLWVVGRCADWIADLYFNDRTAYAVFKADVAEEFGTKVS